MGQDALLLPHYLFLNRVILQKLAMVRKKGKQALLESKYKSCMLHLVKDKYALQIYNSNIIS